MLPRFSPCVYFVLVGLLTSVSALSEAAVIKDVAPDIAIRVRLNSDGSEVSGVAEYRIVNNTNGALQEIPFWLYPNRFETIPNTLEDYNISWVYPRGARTGGIEITEVAVNRRTVPRGALRYASAPEDATPPGQERVLLMVPLSTVIHPEEVVTIRIQFTTRVPVRRGRFGRHKGVVSLAGGWFPRPLADQTGRQYRLPFAPVQVSVEVALPAKRGAVLGQEVFPWKEEPRVIAARMRTASVTLVVMDLMHVETVVTDTGTAVYVSRQLPPKPARWSDNRGREHPDAAGALPVGLSGPGVINYPDRAFALLETVKKQIVDVAPDFSLPPRVVMVEIPAWDKLVQLSDTTVLISDRTWRLIPGRKTLFFHDRVVLASLATRLAIDWTRKLEAPMFRDLVAEVIGNHLADRIASNGGATALGDLVGFASFVPYIDDLLYAPQIPFHESYTPSIEEPDPLRDAPNRFMNELPGGKRILAKLEDRLSVDVAGELMVAYLTDGTTDFFSLANRRLKEFSERFWDQWLGEYPSVNYRIGRVVDQPRDGQTICHQVELIREGAFLVEPVAVRISDTSNAYADRVWSGEDSRGQVEWCSTAPLESVEIDPFHRLVESPDFGDEHPLMDNVRPLPWRPPLWTELVVWGDTVTRDPFVVLGFAFRRKFDVTNSFHLSAAYTPRVIGGQLAYLRHFGPKRTLNARTWYAGPGVSVYHYRRTEDPTNTLPASSLASSTMASVDMMLGQNDRTYGYDPRSGKGFGADIGWGIGRDENGRTVQNGRGSLSVVKVWSPSVGHNIVATLGTSGLLGSVNASRLVTLSSRSRLRGFDLGETYGKVELHGVTEYRHTLIGATSMTGPLRTHMDRIQGVLFVGAGTVTQADSYHGMFKTERIFLEAGYGLRFHLLFLGALPYLLAVDFAVPILPMDRSYLLEQSDGTTVRASRAPFRFVFGITQAF